MVKKFANSYLNQQNKWLWWHVLVISALLEWEIEGQWSRQVQSLITKVKRAAVMP
jgi:hypothetical protein